MSDESELVTDNDNDNVIIIVSMYVNLLLLVMLPVLLQFLYCELKTLNLALMINEIKVFPNFGFWRLSLNITDNETLFDNSQNSCSNGNANVFRQGKHVFDRCLFIPEVGMPGQSLAVSQDS